MGSAADYLENKVLDHVTGKTSFTKPTAYVALSTTTPADDGTNFTEPAGGSYARVTTSGATWNAAASGSVANATAITFAEATAGWGTITHFALFDAASSGNMLVWGALSASKTVYSGDTAKFSAGDITITLD